VARRDDVTGLRSRDAGDQVEECRLARTARPDNGNTLSIFNMETRNVEAEIAFAVLKQHVLNLDHRSGAA
jgi:hypothetical protein